VQDGGSSLPGQAHDFLHASVVPNAAKALDVHLGSRKLDQCGSQHPLTGFAGGVGDHE
jgi:hypothetical protein